MDTTCAEYENGTALHIAAANLGVSAARILLNFGADSNLTDDLARKPLDCIPEIHAIGTYGTMGRLFLSVPIITFTAISQMLPFLKTTWRI